MDRQVEWPHYQEWLEELYSNKDTLEVEPQGHWCATPGVAGNPQIK